MLTPANQYPKLSINILGFNEKHLLDTALQSIFEQDYPNYEVTYIDNASTDDSEQYVRTHFPHVKVIQTGENRHYGPAHNKGLAATDGELVSFVNSDLKFEPTYYSEAVKALLADEKIAGVGGKMLRPKLVNGQRLFDSTGLTIDRFRIVRDRGQWQPDTGQYDRPEEMFALCGAAPVYRRQALEAVAIDGEILDEDITAFFDDSDLGWRLRHQGWKIWYQPTAVLYHERGVGQSPGGYRHLFKLVKFRKQFSLRSRQLSWKNKIYIVLKNDFGKTWRRDWWRIVFRELVTFVFVLLFETATLKILPTVFKQLPNIFRKRKIIKQRSVLGDNNIINFIS